MDKHKFQQALRRVFWLPFAMAVVLALTLIVEVQVLASREQWVQHTDQVIALAARLYRSRIDQESGLRAYLLTRDSRFLDTFHEEENGANSMEAHMTELIADNPGQTSLNERVIKARQAWSAWAQEALAKPPKDAGDLQFQLRGDELMDHYRALRAEFADQEAVLRDRRIAASRRSLQYVNGSIIGLCALMAVMLGGFARKQMRSLARSFNKALDTAELNHRHAQEEKEWLHTTLCSIGDAVIATDAQGRATFVNPVAEQLTGWSNQEARGKPLNEVFHIVNQQTRELVENPIDKVRRLNKVVGLANHTVLISRTGEEFAIDDSGAPIFGDDHTLIGIVLVFRDVSRQRALEAALRSNERLALAGRLSASIAHEIHNPLDTVGNLLFLLSREVNGQGRPQELIEMAQREVYRVAETSKNMLSLHRESSNPAPLSVAELLMGVVALIEETIAKGKRKISIEPGFDGEIEGFAAELRQVFTNVIKNAVEATPEGGTIQITSTQTREHGREGVLIQVTDNGSGVSDEMHSKLFSPFVTTKQESGTGLGLWVSRSIVEKHGGGIRIGERDDSLPGTTVSIFLPRYVLPSQSENVRPDSERESTTTKPDDPRSVA